MVLGALRFRGGSLDFLSGIMAYCGKQKQPRLCSFGVSVTCTMFVCCMVLPSSMGFGFVVSEQTFPVHSIATNSTDGLRPTSRKDMATKVRVL